ncbi:MAG: OsmC family protein [Chloroflexota bacterium]
MTQITATNTLNYQVLIKGNSHEMIADEPTSVGGDDLGFSPFELLLSSLAACTAMTVKMYAKRKDWPLKEINLTLNHEKISAEACDNCLTLEGKIDRINIKVGFEGDLDEEQIERLKYIAGRCPIHRSLVTETQVNIL